MVCNFVYTTYEVDSEVLAMDPTPCDELIRLRGQLESLAKGEALYSRRDANWIDWQDAQKARLAAVSSYRTLPATASYSKKQHALKEWLIISLHTLAPPDRIGVIRKLRLGMTIYKREGEPAYTLDMTTSRYKTSRFCKCICPHCSPLHCTHSLTGRRSQCAMCTQTAHPSRR